MSDKKSAHDLSGQNIVEVMPGIKMATKASIGTLLNLEKSFGKPITEIDFDNFKPDMDTLITLIASLVAQAEGTSLEVAVAKIKSISADKLPELTSNLKNILNAEIVDKAVPNSNGPVSKTVTE